MKKRNISSFTNYEITHRTKGGITSDKKKKGERGKKEKKYTSTSNRYTIRKRKKKI